MEFGQRPDPKRRIFGLVVVVALHVVVIYALVEGLKRAGIEVLPPPITTKIVEEKNKTEPPPPPPPPPTMDLPPPPFIPPPTINLQQPPPRQNTIHQVSKEPTPPPPKPAPPGPVVRAPVVKASGCRTPEYPSISQRLGEEGTVILQMLVGTDGKVTDSRVATSSGYERLDEAARRALSRCRFEPGTEDGKPVQAWASIKYTWKIPK